MIDKLRLAVIPFFLLGTLAACDYDEGPMEETGEEFGQTMENTGEAIDNTAEDAAEGMENAGDQMTQ